MTFLPVDGDLQVRTPPELVADRPAHDVFLRRLNGLYPLHPHESRAVAGLIHNVTAFGPHQNILMDQRPSTEAVVLLDGLACHYRALDTARRQMTGFIVPGDFCDSGFLSSSPVRQCVMSLGDTIVGYIDLGQLATIADKLPNIIVAAMRAASIEQASSRELVINLGARDAVQRLAHFLCEIHYRLRGVGLVSAGGKFELPMTQSEFGEALGLSTVHVNRTIQQLRRKKLITMAQGLVTILDQPGLAAVAQFDGRYLRPN
ncbi:MAG: Crp/Fnr family transcriptional regulator [Devosia sp.]|nr:Crp/Fnr family transcriptional regulator [Devosia sp.]